MEWISYLKVICAQSWEHKETLLELRSPKRSPYWPHLWILILSITLYITFLFVRPLQVSHTATERWTLHSDRLNTLSFLFLDGDSKLSPLNLPQADKSLNNTIVTDPIKIDKLTSCWLIEKLCANCVQWTHRQITSFCTSRVAFIANTEMPPLL